MLRNSALVVITLGMLHAVTLFWKGKKEIDLVILGMIVYTWLLFLLCLLLAVGKRNPLISMCGALLPLIADLFLDYSIFMRPTSSTAAIGLLFMPFCNLVLFMPIGFLVGYLMVLLFKKGRYL